MAGLALVCAGLLSGCSSITLNADAANLQAAAALPQGTPQVAPGLLIVPTPLPTATPTLTPTPTVEVLRRGRIFLGRIHVHTPTPTITPIPPPTPDGTRRATEVPLLMYHYIEQAPPGADAIRRDLSLPPDVFEAQLDRIQDLGYQTITLKHLVEHLTLGVPLPAKPIVLTFDDGYLNHYTEAFPRLRARGMTGTFFIISEYPHSGNRAYMTWDMIREMHREGMEMEAHARYHATLQGRNDAYLREEAMGNIERFEQELGFTPRIIAYPMGQYDNGTIDAFHGAGFWAGLTTRSGVVHDSQDMFRLRRVRIHGYMRATHLEYLLSEEGLEELRNRP